MKNTIKLIATSLSATLLLTGCAHDQVSVKSALQQLGAGLAGMRAAELNELTNAVFIARGQTNFSTGLFVSSATVTFNVTTSKNRSNTLTVDVSAAVPQSPVTGRVGDTFSSSSSETRANQITVNFVSPLFTITTTQTPQTNGTVVTKVVQGITDPTNIVAFYNAIQHGTNGAVSGGSENSQPPGPFSMAK